MNLIPFAAVRQHPTRIEAELAAQLRALAAEVESGEVSQLVITVIRPDGIVERLGAGIATSG